MFKNSCEKWESQSLYELNKKYLMQINKKKASLSKRVKVLLSYLAQGYLKRFFIRSSSLNANDSFTLKKYDSFFSGRIAIYTSLFGDYDKVCEPLYVNDNIDYFIFTDQPLDKNSIWKKMDLPNNPDFKKLTSVDKNRYFKILPHLFFQDYDYSIYVDANVLIVTDLSPIVADCKNKIIAIHKYPLTNCIYDMGKSIIAGKKASKKDVREQLAYYRKKGLPKNYGAFECNIIVRAHNNSTCIKIMETWWKDFMTFHSRRDQLSFMFALWANNLQSDFVFSLGANVRFNPRFQVLSHKIKVIR